MEDAHSAVIGIPDQKENVSWFAGDQIYTSISFVKFFFVVLSFWFAGQHFLCHNFYFRKIIFVLVLGFRFARHHFLCLNF